MKTFMGWSVVSAVGRLLVLGNVLFSTATYAGQIALTFDDAPRWDGYLSGKERATRLLNGLQAVNVAQAGFFVNTERLTGEGAERVARYGLAGHRIANHTHSHPDFNRTTLESYVQDFRKADALLSAVPGFWKAFRFPFLREGNTQEKQLGMRAALSELHYQNAYITVNNYDWEMDRLFQHAVRQKKTVDFAALKDVYIQILLECVQFYEVMAQRVLGRSPKHVLLLHENDLAAMFITDLVQALEAKGWKIISPTEAYQDPIAHVVTNQLFPFNPGRIGEIASDAGYSGDLWHESCDETYVAKKFEEKKVFSSSRKNRS